MSRPPLILLHGAGGNARSFEPLEPLLASRPWVALPYPGRTPGTRALASVADLAGWAEARLRAKGHNEVELLGHSLGGAVALELALSGSLTITRLVLCATGARLRVHPMILDTICMAAEASMPVPMPEMAFGPQVAPEVVTRAGEVWSGTDPEGALADWRCADGFDRMNDLARIDAPALVLVGENDSFTPPAYAHFLGEHLPDARVAVHPSAGHMLPWEDPRWVVEELDR